MLMLTANSVFRSLPIATFGLCLAVGCGGDPKPAAKTPASASKKTAQAPAGDAQKPAEADKGSTKAEPAGDKVKVVDGKAPGGDDRYALSIDPPAEATAGQPGEVMVRVIPKKPWHMNLDFPTSLKVTPPEGVSLANAHLKKGDALKLDDSACEFSVKFTPDKAGEHAFTGQFKFAVCQDEACSPVTEDVQFTVAVK